MTIGHLIILCGPSGSGKTTIQNILAERNKDLFRSISATSRAPRPGEVDGKDYHFISKDEFLDGINQWGLVYEPAPRFTFLEYTTYGGHFYGTPAEPLQDAISKGKTAIAVFDLRGAVHYQQKHVNATSIFIEPPDVDTLQARLEKRGSTNEETVRRLETALTEIKMGREELDYVVKNTNLEDSITQVHEIMIKATARWQNRHLLTDEQKALVEKELDLPITMREGKFITLRECNWASYLLTDYSDYRRKHYKALYLARLDAGYQPETVHYAGVEYTAADIRKIIENDEPLSDSLINEEMRRLGVLAKWFGSLEG